MAFVQVIEYETSKPEDVQRLHEEWEQAAQGKHSAKRLLMTKHHDDENRYCDVVFFDSYEQAMENSKLPETQEFAKKFSEVVDDGPSYIDLDVVDEQAL